MLHLLVIGLSRSLPLRLTPKPHAVSLMPQSAITRALDARSAPSGLSRPGFDLNADGELDVEDLYTWHALGADPDADLDASGIVDGHDREYLEAVVRWLERQDMEAGRRP